MIIFKDLFGGDELFSDIYPMKLIDGVVFKVTGKMTTEVYDIDERAIGGNASAEGGGEEGAESSSKQGINIIMAGRLTEYVINKKDYMTYIKNYMAEVKAKLTSDNPDQVELFQKNVQPFIKEVLNNFKEYQFYCGESMNPDGMLALLKWEDETPYMYFFKHGLIEEKV